VLREAAALMRERAAAATPGVWSLWPDGIYVNPDSTDEGWLIYDAQVLEVSEEPDEFVTPDDAVHIASWHPAVALAVADWLDAEADRHESLREHGGRGLRVDGQVPNAFTVAHAYLGTTP
jgi:hypothetical protein